jgi:hypothetical protein
VVQRHVELVDGVGPECVSHLGTVESDPHHAGVPGAVIGDVGEVEPWHQVPGSCVEDLRNHESRG